MQFLIDLIWASAEILIIELDKEELGHVDETIWKWKMTQWAVNVLIGSCLKKNVCFLSVFCYFESIFLACLVEIEPNEE